MSDKNQEEYFICKHCKNKILLTDYPTLTKNDFNYCPYCGKPIEK